MRIPSLILFLLGILGFLTAAADAWAQTDVLDYGGRSRTYLVHLPPQYDVGQDTLYSLILAYHGGFGSSNNLETQSQLSAKADTARSPFIVVYPDGVRSLLGIRTWNAGWCCGFAAANAIDDVGFTSALIDIMLADYKVDPKRVFATGISNGGMMSYRLAEELSARIAGIAPVAATMTHSGPWMPANGVPIIHFHSDLDSSVPIAGGIGDGPSAHYNPPVDSVHAVWGELNDCTTGPITVFDQPNAYSLKAWSDCADNADIRLYVTDDGGHSWPGGNKTVIGDPTSSVLNANDLMWSFFLEHGLSSTSTSIERIPASSNASDKPHSFPNPFYRETKVVFEYDGKSDVVGIVFDLLGKQVSRQIQARVGDRNRIFTWDGTDAVGRAVPSGIYIYRIHDGVRSIATGAMILLR